MARGTSLSSKGRQRFSSPHFHCSPSPMESWDDSPFPESWEDTRFPSLQNAYCFYLSALRTPTMALKCGPNVLFPGKPSLSTSPWQPTEGILLSCIPTRSSSGRSLLFHTVHGTHLPSLSAVGFWGESQGRVSSLHPQDLVKGWVLARGPRIVSTVLL